MDAPLKPDQVMAKAREFMESRVLLTGAELDLFSLLADQALSADEVVEKTGYYKRPAVILMDALAAMGLLVKKDGTYRTEPSAADFLRADSPRTILPMLLHAATIWEKWSNLTEIARDTGAPKGPLTVTSEPEAQKAFIGAMHVAGLKMAEKIVAAVDPGQARNLLDVGGASGTYTLAFLKARNILRATIFDLPPVVEMARERVIEAGMLERVSFVAGDFYLDDLPEGYDLALLSAIIHQNGPEQNLALFKKVFTALDAGGRIIIRDHVMSPDRTSPVSGAMFAVNMLSATQSGGTYTFEEIKAGLREAGFEKIALLQSGMPMAGLVEAYKP